MPTLIPSTPSTPLLGIGVRSSLRARLRSRTALAQLERSIHLTRQAMTAVTFLSDVEQHLTEFCPEASARLGAIADGWTDTTVEVLRTLRGGRS